MVALHIIVAFSLFVLWLSFLEYTVERWVEQSIADRFTLIAIAASLLTACILLIMGAYNHFNA